MSLVKGSRVRINCRASLFDGRMATVEAPPHPGFRNYALWVDGSSMLRYYLAEEMLEVVKPQFRVMVEGKGAPRHNHDTYEAAEAEAERLLTTHQREVFRNDHTHKAVILQVVGEVVVTTKTDVSIKKEKYN